MIKFNPLRIVFTASGFIKGCCLVVVLVLIAFLMHSLAEFELNLIAESVQKMRENK